MLVRPILNRGLAEKRNSVELIEDRPHIMEDRTKFYNVFFLPSSRKFMPDELLRQVNTSN